MFKSSDVIDLTKVAPTIEKQTPQDEQASTSQAVTLEDAEGAAATVPECDKAPAEVSSSQSVTNGGVVAAEDL